MGCCRRTSSDLRRFCLYQPLIAFPRLFLLFIESVKFGCVNNQINNQRRRCQCNKRTNNRSPAENELHVTVFEARIPLQHRKIFAAKEKCHNWCDEILDDDFHRCTSGCTNCQTNRQANDALFANEVEKSCSVTATDFRCL